eukprot:CAMPEP_0178994102 /NCGR_PEP_ID=MMETSP0795-20121207/7088_1 /TAXON_ID=88552 /ORGANISM="Amoebophrya sp., Strain Ameob2" /LENGTH=368 /DNA_ID=CAMNT_0020686267 /DNA_START=27 /DNA_END=1129 /DNA_ORIENTATION=-
MLLGSSLFFVGGTLLLSAEKVVGQTTTTTTTTSTTPLTYTSPPPALGLYTFAGAVLVEFRFSGAPLAHDDNRLHCDAATHKILPARAAQVLTHGVVRAAISRVIFQQTVADGLSTGPGMATLFWPGFFAVPTSAPEVGESDAAVRVAWDNLRVFVGSAATQAAASLPSAAAEVLFQGGENGQGSVGNVTCVAGQGLGEPPHSHLPHQTVTTSTASSTTSSANPTSNIAENTFSARFPYFVTQVATEQGPLALAKMEKVACNGSRREPQCLDSDGNPQQSAEYRQFRTELEEMLTLGREDASGFAGGSASGGWFGVPSSSALVVNDLTSVEMYPTSGSTETSSAGVHLPPTAESAGVSPAIFVVLGLLG